MPFLTPRDQRLMLERATELLEQHIIHPDELIDQLAPKLASRRRPDRRKKATIFMPHKRKTVAQSQRRTTI